MTSTVARAAGPDGASPLERLGEAVACDARSIPLAAPKTLWLVTGGSLDLFAVDTTGGRWHHVGTIEAGTVLCAPIQGPRHTLVARPLEDAALRRIRISELGAAQREQWAAHRDADGLSTEERALARGIDLGLAPLLDFAREGLPPRDFLPLLPGTELELGAGQSARPIGGILWIDVLNGRIHASGLASFRDREAGDSVTLSEAGWLSSESYARIRVNDTAAMLARSELWEALIKVQARALFTVDRAVERREQVSEDRNTMSRQAGETARDKANHALHAVIKPNLDSLAAVSLNQVDPTFAACRLVADDLGLTVSEPGGQEVSGKVGPIERIAIRSRIRSRTIALKGTWWRTDIGPLVGYRGVEKAPIALRWRSGRYQAVDPVTGESTPITQHVASEISELAVMLYLPLPERPVSTWQLLLFGLRGSLRDLRTMAVSALIAVLLGLLIPIATGEVLGSLVPNGETELIVQLCLGLVAASLASAAFLLLEGIALLRVEGRFESTLQAAVWDRLLRLPATFFARHSTGELANAALGIKQIRTVLAGSTSVVLHATVLAVANFGLLFIYSVPLALLAGACLVLSTAVFVTLGVRQMTWQSRLLEVNYRLINKVFQTLRGLPKLRVAAAENHAYADWAADFVRGKDYQKRIARYQNLITAFNAGYVPLCTLALYLSVASSAVGTLSVAQFLACSTAFSIMLVSMMQVTNSITSIVAVVPRFRRLKPVLTEPLEVSEDSAVPGELSGKIDVNHLSFGYSEDAPPVLADVSFSVKPGEFVAIVGPSGCGKSTLLRLLLGFEKPISGSILYDGQDLSSLDIAAVRRQCGVVLQSAKTPTGTIFQAIAGAQNFSVEEAWEAAEMAGLREDIDAMAMGMHTILSESATLSGGQRQRLVIAQALIRRPRILFFDEATSALDNETQRMVTNSTKRLHATRIVIAHRLSTVLDADKVIVLSEGRVAECGSPGELLGDSNSIFHHLVRRQMPEAQPDALPHKE